MVELQQGAWRARVVHVLAELGVPDLLAQGPATVAQIAEAVGAHEPTLRRLLRAASTSGVFQRSADGETYEHTELSAVLCTDPPNPESTDALFQAATWHWRAWGELLHCARTGEGSFEVANGTSFWELNKQDPDARARFNAAMGTVSREEAAAVAATYDFSGLKSVVDVGGGLGALLSAVLRANPDLRGTLLDRPDVVPLAEEVLVEQGVHERCETVPGDFFESVPEGADVYLIKRVLHDWEHDDMVRILSKIKDAMRPDSKLLAVEGVLDDDATQDTLFRDLVLLVLVGGGEHTVKDYHHVLERAGLKPARTLATGVGPLTIIEATR